MTDHLDDSPEDRRRRAAEPSVIDGPRPAVGEDRSPMSSRGSSETTPAARTEHGSPVPEPDRGRCARGHRAPRRSALAAARRDPGRPGARGARRGDPRAGRRPAARGAPGIQAGPAAQGPAADLRRPDPAPRRHRQDDRGPSGRRRRAPTARQRSGASWSRSRSRSRTSSTARASSRSRPRATASIPGVSAPSPRWRRTTPIATRRSPPGCARGSSPARS